MMKRNIQTGLLTEISCQYDFSKLGIVLYAPITTDSRSDFIAEINGQFLRIQCKSSSESIDGNSFSFSTCSTNWNTRTRRTYEGQIDYFYTCHKGQGYLIPITETNKRSKTLRLIAKDAKNTSINWASDYEIEKVLKEIDPTLNEDASTPISSRSENYCIDCGAPISRRATRCHQCYVNFSA